MTLRTETRPYSIFKSDERDSIFRSRSSVQMLSVLFTIFYQVVNIFNNYFSTDTQPIQFLLN
ncbi:MAG: hypothetical protein BWK80_23475 [Desulfobacteraceae bacterium IS3]|nr:MAG: hypothetical protein BWK80_23475 [Desulfobacteraceae bacterium IS3]